MRNRIAGLAGLVLLLVAGRAEAVSIGLVPSATTVASGQLVSVDVVVSGLGAGAAPTVSSFDLDVAFAAPALGLAGVVFGTGLGTGAQVLTSVSVLPGPIVDFAAASLLSSATLDAQQPASFVLATLTFVAGPAGVSALSIAQAILADTIGGPGGNAIPIDELTGTEITVVVPEPATLALLALGLAALGRRGARG